MSFINLRHLLLASMNANLKTIGWILSGFAVVLLIVLAFVKTDVDRQSVFLCEKVKETNSDMENCPVHKSNISWMIVLAFGIAFLLFGVGLYLLFLYKQAIPAQTSFKEVDVSKFDEEEKKIYELLKFKEGSAYQTDLIKETEFSKVKITRLLDRLEFKGVLERKRRGMTNIIVLK